MKYLMVGDLHGKEEIVQSVLSDKWDEYHKVFVGDYVDSFDRSIKEQISIVRTLLSAVHTRKDVTALIGNHELSYLRQGMECSGRRSKTKYYMAHLSKDVLAFFKTHIWLDEDTLVTHAGATVDLFPDKEDLNKALEEDDTRLYNIGRWRGGSNTYGGIFWCDFWGEFKNLPELTQIVGHSSHRPKDTAEGVHFKDRAYNIDCLDRVREGLVYDGESFEIVQI